MTYFLKHEVCSTNFLDVGQAEAFVVAGFRDSPERLEHILVLAERVRQGVRDIVELNPGTVIDEKLAYAAGLVHDIGYLEEISVTGFHPLDGYHFLMERGFPQLAERIVAHSCAPEEAELLGLELPSGVSDLIAKLITYWDVQVGPRGEIVSYQDRLQDIYLRYGENSLKGEAHKLADTRLSQLIEEINRLLQITAG